MEKLLHERLREHEYRNKCTGMMFADIIGCEKPACVGDDCSDCTACLLEHFADEIERDYIPRPRFEDGEYASWGSQDIKWKDTDDYNPQAPRYMTAISSKGEPLATSGDVIVSRGEITDEGYVKRLQPKEPDSLEKLRDDMLNVYAKLGKYEYKGYADRLSALIERGA